MKHIVLSSAVCLCLLGCGQSNADVDIDQAGPALRSALEAWKSGKTPADLESQSPSILMNETDWKAGKRLLQFKMDDKGSQYGRQVRWRVQVRIQDKSGETQDQNATYVIDTTPRIVIVRDSFAGF